MNVTIVDYNSGNISSVINSFKEVEKDKVNIEVTADLATIKTSDKVVLGGYSLSIPLVNFSSYFFNFCHYLFLFSAIVNAILKEFKVGSRLASFLPAISKAVP